MKNLAQAICTAHSIKTWKEEIERFHRRMIAKGCPVEVLYELFEEVNFLHRPERTNLSYINQCSRDGMDKMMVGKVEDGRRYLGNGSWEKLDHEWSETNERREGHP